MSKQQLESKILVWLLFFFCYLKEGVSPEESFDSFCFTFLARWYICWRAAEKTQRRLAVNGTFCYWGYFIENDSRTKLGRMIVKSCWWLQSASPRPNLFMTLETLSVFCVSFFNVNSSHVRCCGKHRSVCSSREVFLGKINSMGWERMYHFSPLLVGSKVALFTKLCLHERLCTWKK